MLSNELPVKLDVERLCKQAKSAAEVFLCGTVKASRLTGIKDLLTDLSGTVYVELSIRIDTANIPYIKGKLIADLPLTCERCLGTMIYELNKEFLLCPINDISQESKCPEAYEPVLLTEGFLSVAQCITEEILLSLPLAPKHKGAACNWAFSDYIVAIPEEIVD